MLKEIQRRMLNALKVDSWKTRVQLVGEGAGSDVMMASYLSTLEEERFVVSRIRESDPAEVQTFRKLNGGNPLPQREYTLTLFGVQRRDELQHV